MQRNIGYRCQPRAAGQLTGWPSSSLRNRRSVCLSRAADPAGIFHLYPADHGFNCEDRGSYDATSAQLARERTLAFLVQKLESK